MDFQRYAAVERLSALSSHSAFTRAPDFLRSLHHPEDNQLRFWSVDARLSCVANPGNLSRPHGDCAGRIFGRFVSATSHSRRRSFVRNRVHDAARCRFCKLPALAPITSAAVRTSRRIFGRFEHVCALCKDGSSQEHSSHYFFSRRIRESDCCLALLSVRVHWRLSRSFPSFGLFIHTERQGYRRRALSRGL
jgi:hypothetical protein